MKRFALFLALVLLLAAHAVAGGMAVSRKSTPRTASLSGMGSSSTYTASGTKISRRSAAI